MPLMIETAEDAVALMLGRTIMENAALHAQNDDLKRRLEDLTNADRRASNDGGDKGK